MTKRSPAMLVAMALLALCTACTREPVQSLDLQMASFYAAAGTSKQAGAIRALVRSGIPADQIAERLRAGRMYSPDVPVGWSVHFVDSIDCRTRPFQVYVPESYDDERKHPVIVYLHGGIGTAYTVEELAPQRKIWESAAATLGALIIMPHGDRSASWWSRAGLANVVDELAFVKGRYNVDENRVFLSGFSDGGSGVLWMALQNPTSWAGFIAWYGDPSVSAGGSYLCYPRNLLNRPMRMVNGRYDELYPAEEIRLCVDQMQALGADVSWEAYPTEHDFEFFAEERERSISFVSTIVRNPCPERVVWETSDLRVGRCDWIRVDEIRRERDSTFEAANLLFLEAPNTLGVVLAVLAEGGGYVSHVRPGFVADRCGVRRGDWLESVNGVEVASWEAIRGAMDGTEAGDTIEIGVLRDGGRVQLYATTPEPFPVYPRHETVGSIEAIARGNRIEVTAHNVRRFTLFLSSLQFDLDQPIEVFVNGVTPFLDMVKPDVGFMLEQAAADLDRQAVYEAKLEITVVPGGR